MSFGFKPKWQAERANAQEIGRSLRRSGIPSKDVSNAVPCLFRSAMTYRKHTQERSLSQIPVSLIFLVPYFLIFSSSNKPYRSALLDQLSDPDILNIAIASLFVIIGARLLIIPPKRYLGQDQLFRQEYLLPKRDHRGWSSIIDIYFNIFAPLFGWRVRPISRSSIRLIGILNVILFGGILIAFVFETDLHKLWYA